MPENPFFKKDFQNRTYFTKISEYFWKILKGLIFLEELYKSRQILDELYYLVETFIKKAKNRLDGGLLEMQRRRQDFFGGTLLPLNGYHALPAGDPGGEAPPGW